VEQTTFSPVFEYKKVHHIPCVTPEFIKYLKGAIEMQIHVTQHIEPPAVSSALSLCVHLLHSAADLDFESGPCFLLLC
jgi:hypothetical protein